jgi:hypothetical protein
MNRTFEQLSQHQALLVERAAAQRAQLGEIHTSLEEPLAWLRSGLMVVKTLRSHPQMTFLTVVLTSLTLGRRITKARSWLARALAAWQLYRILAMHFLQR